VRVNYEDGQLQKVLWWGLNIKEATIRLVPECRGLVRGGNDGRLGLVVSRAILGAALMFGDNLDSIRISGGGGRGSRLAHLSRVRTYWAGAAGEEE
jgi:hypothetical protein